MQTRHGRTHTLPSIGKEATVPFQHGTSSPKGCSPSSTPVPSSTCGSPRCQATMAFLAAVDPTSVRTRRSSVHSMSTSEPAIATNAMPPDLALAGKRQRMGPRLMPDWSIRQSMRDGSQQNGTTIHGPRMRSPPLRGHGESAVPRATRRAALLPGCRVWRLNAGPQAGY